MYQWSVIVIKSSCWTAIEGPVRKGDF
eukprot:COSAG02_NODE_45756_length_354_cov_0.909804_1_plen_26_part_10